MKGGDEDLIDDQATLLVTIQGQIKEMSRMKTTLTQISTKIKEITRKQELARSMASVNKALGSATQIMQAEKVTSTQAPHSRSDYTDRN
jgi:hypothetical protein